MFKPNFDYSNIFFASITTGRPGYKPRHVLNRYKIGHGDCALYWKGDSGEIHNAEFRCGEGGDEFWIIPGNDTFSEKYEVNKPQWLTRNIMAKSWSNFQIGYSSNDDPSCVLYGDDDGDIANAEFRCNDDEERVWINQVNGNKEIPITNIDMISDQHKYRIGYFWGDESYELYFKKDDGNIKNAEFRKLSNGSRGDLFWIKPINNNILQKLNNNNMDPYGFGVSLDINTDVEENKNRVRFQMGKPYDKTISPEPVNPNKRELSKPSRKSKAQTPKEEDLYGGLKNKNSKLFATSL